MKTRLLLVIIVASTMSLAFLLILSLSYQSQKAPFDRNEIQWCSAFFKSNEYLDWKKEKDQASKSLSELYQYEPKFTLHDYRIIPSAMMWIEPYCSKAIEYGSYIMGMSYSDSNSMRVVQVSGKDALDICSALRLPCPTNPVSYGKMLDENNVLVKISGTRDFDVKLNQTHVCVTSKTETMCELR